MPLKPKFAMKTSKQKNIAKGSSEENFFMPTTTAGANELRAHSSQADLRADQSAAVSTIAYEPSRNLTEGGDQE